MRRQRGAEGASPVVLNKELKKREIFSDVQVLE